MSFKTKEEALDALEQARWEYLIEARLIAVKLARKHGEITVNDVREKCPPPPEINPKVMGAIFNTKDWEPVGFHVSKRAHNRIIRTWRLV
jgi:hypothetical protein